jgi:hypothetical protein
MNKGTFTTAITMIIVTIVLISCRPATREEIVLEDKVQQAKENVDMAQDTLDEARKVAKQEDWQNFRNEADPIIKVNDARIAELKVKMKNTGERIDSQYKKSIDTLEQKNQNLKVKIKTYKSDANDDWQSFKTELNHDMTEIGQALKNVTINNKK